MPPLRFLDVPLLGDAALSHFAGTDAAGAGWGRYPWERRNVRTIGRQLDLEALAIRDTALDVRDFCVALWDPGISHEAPTLDRRGLAFLAQGNRRTWTRASAAWIESAAAARQGTVQLAELVAHQDKHAALGTLLEDTRTNGVIQSSFKNGSGAAFTGWTLSGTGSNGSAFAEETGDLLFLSTTSGRVMKIIGGSPIHAADLQAQATTTASYTANTKVRLSVYYKDLLTGVGAWWALQRAVDSKWWRESDGTWQASKIWNQAAYSGVWARVVSRQIDVGASNTTLTAFVGIPTSGGAAGDSHLVGHVQIEDGNYATSPIHCEATPVTRQPDYLTIANDHGRRVWPPDFLTARATVVTLWSTSELPSGAVRVFLDAYYDADNYDRLFYEQASGNLIARRRRAATNYDAVKAVTFTAGQARRVGMRVTGSRGEWGLAPYTVSVFDEGVKGTDAVATGVHVLPSKHSFRIGHRDNSGSPADILDGYYKDLEVRAQVLHDLEMVA